MEAATIGQYRVTGLIGQGGMGAVYAAEHALLGRLAAIKVLLPELSQKQDVVQRFFNEARAATAIRHPGIVEIYDFGWTPDGAAFIVMEHLDGETLSRRSARAGLRWPAALAIARQIAGALSAAHAKGIVHRDLKPDNVFLVSDPEVPGGERIKLLDFGIAKLAGDTAPGMHVTRTGAVMGTPTYMAPEQCRGVAVDHRADLYALGCILFELCTGRPPFLGEGSGDILAAHIHIPVPTLASLGVALPPAVEHLIRRLLAKAPADRVQTADELIRAIDVVTPDRAATSIAASGARAATTSPSTTTLSGSASTSMPRLAKRRGRWSLALFSIAMAIVTVVIVVLVMRSGGDGLQGHQVAAPADLAVPQVVPASPLVERPASASAPGSGPAVATGPATAAPAARPPREPSIPAGAGAATSRPPAAATIDATIESTPAGAQVLLDGTVLGKTPYRGVLPHRAGTITFVLRLTGHVDKAVTVRGDRAIDERVKLARTPARPARPTRDQSVNPFAN